MPLPEREAVKGGILQVNGNQSIEETARKTYRC
jgi:hypothetical protein